MTKRVLLAFFTISITMLGSAARAQQDKADETARIHFQAGTSYYETGDYELALREFNRSYELSGRPELQYNISLTYEKLGDLEAAIEALQKYLSEAKDIPNRRTLEIRLANLGKRLEQQREAFAQEDPNATATGEAIASADSISDEEAAAEQPVAPQQPVPPEPLVEPVEKEPPAQPESAKPEAQGEDPKILGLRTEVFVSYAIAGAGALTFILFGSLAAAEDNSLSDQCLNREGQGTCSESDVSSLETFATVADVGLALALIGGVAGTVLLFTLEDERQSESKLEVRPIAGAEQMGAAARVRF
ncbi:MAG: tetratricopeptide repeat protein [Deltaproteobacteria bacterium]|nr:tetratricopeptide repeat protein [Deltaproteobacteria bacterium]